MTQTAREILGPDRVLVRWEKYLDAPSGIAAMNPAQRTAALAEAMAADAGRFTGRAAEQLAPLCAAQPLDALAGRNCHNVILGAKGVHIDPYGSVFSGQCPGMAVGNVHTTDLDELWKTFDPAAQDFWQILMTVGQGFCPHQSEGFVPKPLYASKCHLAPTFELFFDNSRYLQIICTNECYGKPI